MAEWSEWKSYPDPRKGEVLVAPLGPGVYQVRNRVTRQKVLFGIGGKCAKRMRSLLPAPLGSGTRNNAAKREYMLRNLADLDYRCLTCETREEAAEVERAIPDRREYLFPT